MKDRESNSDVVLLENEAAFECMPFQKFCDAVRKNDVDDTLIKWTCAMLAQRLSCAEMGVHIYAAICWLKSWNKM